MSDSWDHRKELPAPSPSTDSTPPLAARLSSLRRSASRGPWPSKDDCDIHMQASGMPFPYLTQPPWMLFTKHGTVLIATALDSTQFASQCLPNSPWDIWTQQGTDLAAMFSSSMQIAS